MHNNKSTLDIGLVEKLFNTFSRSNTGVTLEGGGEPTLYPNFRDVLAIGEKHNLDMGLISNGTMDISDCVDKLKWVRVSLDSSTRDEYT